MFKPILLWDFDGVMADSTKFVFSFWQAEMAKAGVVFTLSDYQATFTHKFPFEYLSENFGTLAETVKANYSAHETINYPSQVQAFPGFVESFLEIKDTYEHHIISSNLKVVIEDWLRLKQLDPHFRSVIGRETAGYKDEKIETLLTKFNRSKDEALFIGDTISDIEHAQAAGVKNIAVSWGVHTRAQLETVTPDQICDSIESLFKRLKKEHTSSL